MRYLLAVIMLMTVGCATVSNADPTPKGWEGSIDFDDNTTPYRIRVSQLERGGSWVPASFIKIAADDSLRVVAVNAIDDPRYYGASDIELGSVDSEVNRFLRYTPGGQALDFEGPIYELWLYGPGDYDVSVNVWVEY